MEYNSWKDLKYSFHAVLFNRCHLRSAADNLRKKVEQAFTSDHLCMHLIMRPNQAVFKHSASIKLAKVLITLQSLLWKYSWFMDAMKAITNYTGKFDLEYRA